jgi:hypothetical protein
LLKPVADSQAWTAEQKWYEVELKRKSPEKNKMISIKAKDDRDVSASTLHGRLKPENAKIEQLVDASGQNDAKRIRICDHQNLEHVLFLWYQGHETRGAAVTGDVLTRKASSR